jgi:large subunit ribosomal protein L7/L12
MSAMARWAEKAVGATGPAGPGGVRVANQKSPAARIRTARSAASRLIIASLGAAPATCTPAALGVGWRGGLESAMQPWMIGVLVIAAFVAVWLMMPKRRDTLEVGAKVVREPLSRPQPRPALTEPARSAADEIEKLWRLKEEGALSLEEFEVQKARLLAGETSAAVGLQLVLIDAGENKIAVIKRVREITQLGLKEAKDLVESPPQVVAAGLTAGEAEAMRRAFEADGAGVDVR